MCGIHLSWFRDFQQNRHQCTSISIYSDLRCACQICGEGGGQNPNTHIRDIEKIQNNVLIIESEINS